MNSRPAIGAITRTCGDCRQRFEVTDSEQHFLQQLAEQQGHQYRVPNRCRACRAARRSARYDTPRVTTADGRSDWLTCQDCGRDFLFGGRDREYYAARGWMQPKRCRDCRHARRLEHSACANS